MQNSPLQSNNDDIQETEIRSNEEGGNNEKSKLREVYHTLQYIGITPTSTVLAIAVLLGAPRFEKKVAEFDEWLRSKAPFPHRIDQAAQRTNTQQPFTANVKSIQDQAIVDWNASASNNQRTLD